MHTAQILHLVSLHQIIIGEVRGWRKIENSLKMSRVEFLGLKQELSFFLLFTSSPSYSFSTLRFFRITHILYLYPSINVGDKIDVVKKLQVSMKTPGLLCLGIQALKQEEEEEEDVMMVFSYRLGRNIEI